MGERPDSFYSVFEWESLRWPIEFTHLDAVNHYYRIPENAVLKVSRGNDLKLVATLSGFTDHDDFLDYRVKGIPSQPGEVINGEQLEGWNKEGVTKYMAKHFFPQSNQFGFTDSPPKKTFVAGVHVGRLEQVYGDDEKTETIIEFFLCSKINFSFARGSRRIKQLQVSKTRDGIDVRANSADIIVSNQNGWSNDCALVQTPGFDCIVQVVEKDFLPDWANGVQIEYRTTLKGIPNENDRTALSEVAGFALGTHLNKIGETHFTGDRKVIKRVAVSPWGDNVVDKCRSHAIPPVNYQYDYQTRPDKVEVVLNKLASNYLAVRSKYGLSDVLWKYWIAQELAVGTNLPIYSSALESLAENFLKANNIISKYSSEEKENHSNLVETYLKGFFDELNKTSYGSRLINQIKNPFNVGVSEKLSLFFKEIGFDISRDSVENEAMKARNKMTHSAIDSTSSKERDKYTKLTEAYMVLINRCVLAGLMYTDKYVDYYSLGLPERELKENIGTPNS